MHSKKIWTNFWVRTASAQKLIEIHNTDTTIIFKSHKTSKLTGLLQLIFFENKTSIIRTSSRLLYGCCVFWPGNGCFASFFLSKSFFWCVNMFFHFFRHKPKYIKNAKHTKFIYVFIFVLGQLLKLAKESNVDLAGEMHHGITWLRKTGCYLASVPSKLIGRPYSWSKKNDMMII